MNPLFKAEAQVYRLVLDFMLRELATKRIINISITYVRDITVTTISEDLDGLIGTEVAILEIVKGKVQYKELLP